MNDNPIPQAIAPAKLRAPSDALPPFSTEARYVDGLVYVTTTDPARMAVYRKLLRAEGSGWECIRVDTDDQGRQILWGFRGDERLLAPRARPRPAPANGFGAGNKRWQKIVPESEPELKPDPDPQPTPAPKATGLGSDDVEVKTAPRTKEDGTIWSEREPEDQTPTNPNDPWGGFVF